VIVIYKLMSTLDVSRNTFNDFWNKVIDLKIIKQICFDGKEFYCINPLYFNSTRYMPLYLFIAFQDELCEHLPEWVIDRYLDMKENY
jgi:hypothetical protein